VVAPGQLISLVIEKPAAGGSMIARHEGQIVLVGGAIPGERVVARVERVAKGVVHAQTTEVEQRSADRREPFADPLCGGCLYAHVEYARQLELKSQVVADAFARIGRIPLPAPVVVRPSKADGYRMRARLHARGGRVGFFREGTHQLCDARATRQLLPDTCDVLDRLAAGLRSLGHEMLGELEVSENVGASERAVHLLAASPVDPRSLTALAPLPGVTGLSMSVMDRGPAAFHVISGDPHVTDTLTVDGHTIVLKRHVLAFFQGNRYLVADLAAHVIDAIEKDAQVIDLYAGAGLFAVAAAAGRGARVVAVEGDRVAARDIAANAQAAGLPVETVCQSVELFASATRGRADIVLVDPPRTGMSKEAMQGAIRLGAKRFVYVSCDVATLARDARRLLDAGYQLDRIEGFDLFPNTPHVETVVSFVST
jgi:23S rRNA (uracil-5-)-methyltransferase RumA